MQDLNDLYYYAQVVDHGGFAPAGRALGIPKSKLSRRISQLEERLGVRLIQRSTRHFSVTEVGQTYYNHVKAMLVEAEAAQESVEITRSEPRGVVRVTCPVALLDTRVDAMVADFMVLHPQVEVCLESTNRRVDVVGEGIDIAIRVRTPPLEDSDLVLRILAERRQTLLANPVLIERHGMPQSPADLASFPSLALGRTQGEHQWTLYGPDKAQADVYHQPRLVTLSMQALRTAAVAGVGVVQLPAMLVTGQCAAGTLVEVLPGWAPRSDVIHAVYASRRGMLPSVRGLLDYLAERFAALRED